MPACRRCGTQTPLPDLCTLCQSRASTQAPPQEPTSPLEQVAPVEDVAPVAPVGYATTPMQPFVPQFGYAHPVAPVGVPVASSMPVNARHPLAGQGPYADLGRRFVAYLIDFFVYLMLSVAVLVAPAAVLGTDSTAFVTATLVGLLLVNVLYWWVPIALTGYTLGKRLLGVRVVRASDFTAAPGFWYAAVRWATTVALGIIPLGGLIDHLMGVGDNPEYRTVHDRAARTRVIRADWTPQQGYQTVPGAKRSSVLAIVLIAFVGFLVAVVVLGILAAIAIPVFLNQREKGVEATMRNDANTAATTLMDNAKAGTLPQFPVVVSDDGLGRIGATAMTAEHNNTITISLQPGPEGHFCVRVDNPESHASIFLSSQAKTLDHTPCDGSTPPAELPTHETPTA